MLHKFMSIVGFRFNDRLPEDFQGQIFRIEYFGLRSERLAIGSSTLILAVAWTNAARADKAPVLVLRFLVFT